MTRHLRHLVPFGLGLIVAGSAAVFWNGRPVAARSGGQATLAPAPGWNQGLAALPHLGSSRSRAITAENPTGGKGRGGRAVPDPSEKEFPDSGRAADKLGIGWKVRPFLRVNRGQTATLMDVDGPGIIQHIWMVEGLKLRPCPPILLGRRAFPVRRGPRPRLLRRRPWPVRAGEFARGGRQPAERPERLLADAVPHPRPGDADQRVPRRGPDAPGLPDRLCRGRGPRRRRLLPRPVPPRADRRPEPLRDPRRCPGPRPIRRHVPLLGPAPRRGGSARARSNSSSTAMPNSPRSAAPGPRTTSAAATASPPPSAALTPAPSSPLKTPTNPPSSGASIAGT